MDKRREVGIYKSSVVVYLYIYTYVYINNTVTRCHVT